MFVFSYVEKPPLHAFLPFTYRRYPWCSRRLGACMVVHLHVHVVCSGQGSCVVAGFHVHVSLSSTAHACNVIGRSRAPVWRYLPAPGRVTHSMIAVFHHYCRCVWWAQADIFMGVGPLAGSTYQRGCFPFRKSHPFLWVSLQSPCWCCHIGGLTLAMLFQVCPFFHSTNFFWSTI